MKRRNFLRAAAGSAAATWLPWSAAAGESTADDVFRHGVASGDPLPDGFILWTRVSGLDRKRVRVRWRVATDPEFSNIVAKGKARTGPERDYTVKVDVRGLEAGQTYFYGFSAAAEDSPTGRTRTLPGGGLESANFAVVSCSNFPYGYFHVYRDIAEQQDLDAVIHLGDYLYEYGMGGYATEYAEHLGRMPEPPGETVTLADYRARHAQYKADPDSRAMHASLPLIAVWDDHEITNDAWRNGAENHDESEGNWQERVHAAVQAYFEWMPIRGEANGVDTRIYREFSYGDLLTLVMLDTRLVGRDAQPDAAGESDPEVIGARMQDPERQLLGSEQEAWLAGTLDRATSTWQVIGQQVLVAPLRTPDLEPLLDLDKGSGLPREMLEQLVAVSKSGPPMILDTWNGYPVARERFLATLARYADNPVVLTGDMHTSSASNLVPRGGSAPVAVELMTTSVTSPGLNDYLPQVRPNAVQEATLEFNPPLRYLETSRRGWLAVRLTHERCEAEWHLVDTVHREDYTVSVDQSLVVRAGEIAGGLIDA